MVNTVKLFIVNIAKVTNIKSLFAVTYVTF